MVPTRARVLISSLAVLACGRSEFDPGSAGGGGTPGSGGAPAGGGGTAVVVPGSDAGAAADAAAPAGGPIGWAAVAGNGVATTTGGEGGMTVTVTTLATLNAAVLGSTPRVVQIAGPISGSVATIASNKTLVGMPGASIQGHLQLGGSVNVIVRNLTIVGNNCTDSPTDCSMGADAVTIDNRAHHIWFDHDDISDGSDGNLDITGAADFITISWTRFHYSARRTDPAGAGGGHEFSNLIGASDTATGDTGHLRVTFHHVWWADNVFERMPRARFGQIHLFDNLYSSAGNSYCVGVGVGVSILDENNAFVGVKNPIDSADFSNAASVITSRGDLLQNTTGTTRDIGSAAFTPPYAYTLDPAANVQALVMAGAGPQ